MGSPMRRPAQKLNEVDEHSTEGSANRKRDVLGWSADDLRALMQEIG